MLIVILKLIPARQKQRHDVIRNHEARLLWLQSTLLSTSSVRGNISVRITLVRTRHIMPSMEHLFYVKLSIGLCF